MWKAPKNPTVQELTQTCRERRINLSSLTAPQSDGAKLCFWCLAPLTGRQQKWCGVECSTSAFAWANPQSEEGLAVLLARQLYKCAGCALDWNPLADSLLGKHGVAKSLDRLTTFNHRFVKILKNRSINGTLPEVDHIVPISKGGQSIGFENHQALCYTCHKVKSKVDNSGPRAARLEKPKCVVCAKRNQKKNLDSMCQTCYRDYWKKRHQEYLAKKEKG